MPDSTDLIIERLNELTTVADESAKLGLKVATILEKQQALLESYEKRIQQLESTTAWLKGQIK